MMERSSAPVDLEAITATVASLQRSSRRTLPVFGIGILASIIAGGFAVYYIVKLSSDLRVAHTELHRTQTTLAAAQQSLAFANASLQAVQRTAAAHSAKASDTSKIAAAISNVSRSQQDVAAASVSISQATASLPPPPEGLTAAVPTAWFAVIGSYTLDAPGLQEAMQKLQSAQAAGICAEVWQTKISSNYAVVIGTRSDIKGAKAGVAHARQSGLASDAFAIPDSGWTKLPQSPNC
jgi:hypothetical protein